MEITIHDVPVKEFLKLLPVMSRSTEWEREPNEFYMSGAVKIKELEITLYSKDYDRKLGVTGDYSKTKDFDKA